MPGRSRREPLGRRRQAGPSPPLLPRRSRRRRSGARQCASRRRCRASRPSPAQHSPTRRGTAERAPALLPPHRPGDESQPWVSKPGCGAAPAPGQRGEPRLRGGWEREAGAGQPRGSRRPRPGLFRRGGAGGSSLLSAPAERAGGGRPSTPSPRCCRNSVGARGSWPAGQRDPASSRALPSFKKKSPLIIIVPSPGAVVSRRRLYAAGPERVLSRGPAEAEEAVPPGGCAGGSGGPWALRRWKVTRSSTRDEPGVPLSPSASDARPLGCGSVFASGAEGTCVLEVGSVDCARVPGTVRFSGRESRGPSG